MDLHYDSYDSREKGKSQKRKHNGKNRRKKRYSDKEVRSSSNHPEKKEKPVNEWKWKKKRSRKNSRDVTKSNVKKGGKKLNSESNSGNNSSKKGSKSNKSNNNHLKPPPISELRDEDELVEDEDRELPMKENKELLEMIGIMKNVNLFKSGEFDESELKRILLEEIGRKKSIGKKYPGFLNIIKKQEYMSMNIFIQTLRDCVMAVVLDGIKKLVKEGDKEEQGYMCMLGKKVMVEPVELSCGHIFEKGFLIQDISEKKSRSSSIPHLQKLSEGRSISSKYTPKCPICLKAVKESETVKVKEDLRRKIKRFRFKFLLNARILLKAVVSNIKDRVRFYELAFGEAPPKKKKDTQRRSNRDRGASAKEKEKNSREAYSKLEYVDVLLDKCLVLSITDLRYLALYHDYLLAIRKAYHSSYLSQADRVVTVRFRYVDVLYGKGDKEGAYKIARVLHEHTPPGVPEKRMIAILNSIMSLSIDLNKNDGLCYGASNLYLLLMRSRKIGDCNKMKFELLMSHPSNFQLFSELDRYDPREDDVVGAMYYEIAGQFISKNRIKEAIRFLNYSISRNNKQIGSYEKLASCHSRLGNAKEASNTYIRLSKIFDDPRVRKKWLLKANDEYSGNFVIIQRECELMFRQIHAKDVDSMLDRMFKEKMEQGEFMKHANVSMETLKEIDDRMDMSDGRLSAMEDSVVKILNRVKGCEVSQVEKEDNYTMLLNKVNRMERLFMFLVKEGKVSSEDLKKFELGDKKEEGNEINDGKEGNPKENNIKVTKGKGGVVSVTDGETKKKTFYTHHYLKKAAKPFFPSGGIKNKYGHARYGHFNQRNYHSNRNINYICEVRSLIRKTKQKSVVNIIARVGVIDRKNPPWNIKYVKKEGNGCTTPTPNTPIDNENSPKGEGKEFESKVEENVSNSTSEFAEELKYSLSVRIMDHTGHILVYMNGDICETLIGYSEVELKKIHDTDLEKYNCILDSVQYKQFLFRIEATKKRKNNRYIDKLTVLQITKVNGELLIDKTFSRINELEKNFKYGHNNYNRRRRGYNNRRKNQQSNSMYYPSNDVYVQQSTSLPPPRSNGSRMLNSTNVPRMNVNPPPQQQMSFSNVIGSQRSDQRSFMSFKRSNSTSGDIFSSQYGSKNLLQYNPIGDSVWKN